MNEDKERNEFLVIVIITVLIALALLALTGCTNYQADGYTAVSVGWRVNELAEFCRSIR